MEAIFPGKRFVQYSGGRFPFRDKEFDWIFSNAVIEHVGDESAQLEFVNEMLRVAKNVYFTTPYKYFPLESHTNLVFLHWNDRLFSRWLAKHRPESGKYSIYLFSMRRLRELLKASTAADFILRKNRFAGVVMTLTVVCRQSR
jgi:ubiquinone/menaquinone biosynthesis C-methylase UbiE